VSGSLGQQMGGLPRHIQGACGCPAIPVAHRSLTPPARHSSRALGLAMVPHSTVLACVQPRTARGAAQRSRGCLKGAAAADVLLCQQLQQQWWQKLACSTAPGVEPDEFEMESQMETEATSKDILGEFPGSLGVSVVGPLRKQEGPGIS
jgi:hypothetical protein